MTRFICIGGKAQNGKDTASGMLKSALESKGYKVLITHYADLLKFICRNYFGWNGEKDDYGRTLLQRVGTEAIRSQRPDFWVDFVIDVVSLFPNEWDFVIIPDTRFPNEINRLKECGYDPDFVKIYRVDFVSPLSTEQQRHPSETALDHVKPDFVIINRTLEGMKQYIDDLCAYLLEQPKGQQITLL